MVIHCMKHFIFLPIFFFILLTACKQNIENIRLEQALAFSGKNRVELEKVLKHYALYPADSLKYRAACFLIENMPGYYYYEGEELNRHAVYFDALGKSKKQPEQILDSLHTLLGRFNRNALNLKEDIHEIDSAYLCENIDLAFLAWKKYPWNRHTSFDDFCEYILPYRIGNERLTNWRREYYKRVAPLLETLETDDPVVAARYLRNAIIREKGKPRFTMVRPGGYPSLDAFNALFFNGSCDDISQFALFAFRAAGIPCSIDLVIICGNYNLGHSWVVFEDKNGNDYVMDFFAEIEYISDKSYVRKLRKHKAYRKTFSNNIGAMRAMEKIQEDIPALFATPNYRFKDATMLYSNNFLQTVSIPADMLYSPVPQNRIIYLCGPAWMGWKPVDWTVPDKKGRIVFHNQNIGDIARLATYEDGRLSLLTDPFKIDEQNHRICRYAGGKEVTSATLFSKYPIEDDVVFRSRMVGGVFEGSDNPSFLDADTLYVIKDMPYRLITQVPVSANKEYRYVRYKGAADSYCNIAEVRFSSDTGYLTGKTIGTPGCWEADGSHEYVNVFDGLTETSFDHNTPDDGWAGLDFGIPQKISAIAYTPRNHDNYVKKGQKYELFINGKNGWKSLEVKIADSDSLHYENVPSGGLYYLKNHSSGNEERVFLMEGDKQIFK